MIQENYVDGKKLDYNSVFKSSIIGMLRSLDPHSNYYDREEYDEFKTDQRSEYFGIGASIQNYLLGEQADTFITATFQGSPASRAGLRAGDVITKVNNEPAGSRDELTRLLREVKDGGDVTLGIVRDKKESTVTVKLESRRRQRPGRPAMHL